MFKHPDIFVDHVFVPDAFMDAAVAKLQEAKLWANLEDPNNRAFRGGGPNGFMVEGRNVLIMGDESAFGRLGTVLADLSLTRYNTESAAEKTHERGTTDLPYTLFFQ